MLLDDDSEFLPIVKESDFLPPLGRWASVGGIIMLCAALIAIILAAMAKYKVTVQAQAVVRPSGELRIVQAATEGAIMQINVKENQSIKKGDVLATIDNSRFQTKKSQLQSNINQAQLQIVQINAQIIALNNQLRGENNRNVRTIAAAEAELKYRSRDYQDKKITSSADVEEASANVRAAQKELQKSQAELMANRASLKGSIANLNAAITKRNRYQRVAKQGALSHDQFEEAQLAVNQQQQVVESQQAMIEAQKQTIAQLQQSVEAAEARRKRTIASLNPSNAEIAIASERIAQERATGVVNSAALDKDKKVLIQQQIAIQKQLERDTHELRQIEIDLRQTAITASANGIISRLNIRNPGQTVRPGEEIAQIVPDNAPLVIKAAVPSENKSKLKLGQEVQMRVSACPYPDYGTLKGKVKAISPDAFNPQVNTAASDSRTETTQKVAGGSSFYQVTIEPESLSLSHGTRKCSIQLGMEGRADIISRQENVLQFFLRKARLMTDV